MDTKKEEKSADKKPQKRTGKNLLRRLKPHRPANKKKAGMIVLALLVMITAAFALWYVQDKQDSKVKDSQETKATLADLANEHARLINQAVSDASDGKNTDQDKEKLYKVGSDIAKLTAGYYGAEAESSFATAWNVYIDQTLEYVRATKDKNEEAKQLSYIKLQNEFVRPVAQLFAEKNKNINEITLKSSLGAYVYEVRDVINNKINPVQLPPEAAPANTNFDLTGNNMTVSLFYISDANAKQFPDRFKK